MAKYAADLDGRGGAARQFDVQVNGQRQTEGKRAHGPVQTAFG